MGLTVLVTLLFVLTLGTKGNKALKTGLAMLLGGAFSNTYDRLKRKYVVDYFSFGVRWKWLSRMYAAFFAGLHRLFLYVLECGKDVGCAGAAG